ncbi:MULTISPECIES: MerR family transcriptional regulator [Clostridium]|uniref:MerR family transcriptional regulator n=1 Tax=Clostridium TaxID=1485 RepID=UPI002902DF67|nr:MerR family transcriptional regulator [Clostridium sp.]MDU1937217.1 MerR family transcriptional regulator [Clostridium sp.]MDU2045848.1 MerR family transcriptional regulator [Clostridium sp.]
MKYTSKEASEITELSTATLRYYEMEGLIPRIVRNKSGDREYSSEDLEWVEMIKCLRLANVPIRSIKVYVSLLQQGGITINERIQLVEEYKINMMKEIENIQNALNLVNKKLSFYEKIKNENCINLTYLDEWRMFKESE